MGKRIDYSSVEQDGSVGSCIGYGHECGWVVIKERYITHNGTTTRRVDELLCPWCLRIIKVKED
jgi:hypothetical protein